MSDCLYVRPDGRGAFISCRYRSSCDRCGWNPEVHSRRCAELREREENNELVDRALMARSLASFEADLDYGVIDWDSEGHPKWKKGRVYR